jgi:BirA family transcriptional regulator, biotin operon repressor / biotin---[acetyl-CoA-carboxylase] ligase
METMFIGQQLIEADVVDSTNNYAATLINTTKLPEGAVIMAREQTAGRGQRGSSWMSEKDQNLTMSIVLYPVFLRADAQFSLSMMTALSIFEALNESFESISIKWPNDIYAGNEKVAGILIENSLGNDQIRSSVIGIGLNINQEKFPEGINATSLKILSGKAQDLQHWREKICLHLERNYLALRAGRLEIVKRKYMDHLLFLGQLRAYIVGGKRINAFIREVENDGRLLIETESGETMKMDLKEIIFLI